MEIDPELPSGSFPILITMSRVVTANEVKDSLQVRMGGWLTPGTITEQGDNYVITYAPADFKATVPKDGSNVITCTHRFGQTVEEIMWGAHPAIYYRTVNGGIKYLCNEYGLLCVYTKLGTNYVITDTNTELGWMKMSVENLESLIEQCGGSVEVILDEMVGGNMTVECNYVVAKFFNGQPEPALQEWNGTTPPAPVVEQALMYRSNGERNYIVNEEGRLISDGTNVFRETLEGDPLDPFHTGLYYPVRLRAEELASLIDNWGDLVLVLYKAEAYNNYVITYGTYRGYPKLYEFSRGVPQFELNEYRQ